MKTYRFKLYQSERNEKLNKQINAAGLIYNHCIALHKRYYKIFGKYLNKYNLQKHLVKIKKKDKLGYIKEIGSQAVQDITDRIDRAFQLFFSNSSTVKNFKSPTCQVNLSIRSGKMLGFLVSSLTLIQLLWVTSNSLNGYLPNSGFGLFNF